MNKTLASIILVSAATLGYAQQAPRVQSPTASAAASAVAGPSSAPAKPARRLLTPEELRDTAQFPDGVQPGQPTLPQVLVPLGKKPAPLAPTAAGPAPKKIDDTVARCKALTDPRHKSACVHAPAASDVAH
jgi:hypothetical protein